MFPPTYRYERGSRDCYLWQKYKSSGVKLFISMNLSAFVNDILFALFYLKSIKTFPQVQVNGPSWCDRVLWKSYPESHIICTSYGVLLLFLSILILISVEAF